MLNVIYNPSPSFIYLIFEMMTRTKNETKFTRSNLPHYPTF